MQQQRVLYEKRYSLLEKGTYACIERWNIEADLAPFAGVGSALPKRLSPEIN